jgi:hypothetical protein
MSNEELNQRNYLATGKLKGGDGVIDITPSTTDQTGPSQRQDRIGMMTQVQRQDNPRLRLDVLAHLRPRGDQRGKATLPPPIETLQSGLDRIATLGRPYGGSGLVYS